MYIHLSHAARSACKSKVPNKKLAAIRSQIATNTVKRSKQASGVPSRCQFRGQETDGNIQRHKCSPTLSCSSSSNSRHGCCKETLATKGVTKEARATSPYADICNPFLHVLLPWVRKETGDNGIIS